MTNPVDQFLLGGEQPVGSGWYRTVDGNDWLLYSLYEGQWYAHALNGETVPCEWGYIDQAGTVEPVGVHQGVH